MRAILFCLTGTEQEKKIRQAENDLTYASRRTFSNWSHARDMMMVGTL